MLPSLWNRENLDSSDHMTVFHRSRVQSLCSLANWSLFSWLASLISGLLRATKLFSPNPLSSLRIVRVEMLLLSLLNIALSYTVVFLRLDFTKSLSDRQSWSVRIFFRPHFFLSDDGSPLSFQFLIMRWTVLNPILVVFAVSLDVFSAWCMPMISQTD